ncbi:hypothetical protein FRC02_004914 [Tulasnella sp. 418]|nr:hypothetical protein FRC02_004914 [Tulasnella sp. 418]
MKIVLGRENKPANPKLEQTSSSPSSRFDKDKVKARDLHREIEDYQRNLASLTNRDNYAVGLIGTTVSNIIQRRYVNPETQSAREIRLTLEKNFQTRSLILVYHHRKRLKDFSWNNHASIRSNIDGFMSIVMDLRALGHVIARSIKPWT